MKHMKDERSTGRRRARRTLFKERVDFCCVDCKVTTREPPKDAPSWFDDIWPVENRKLPGSSLQADHETKNLEDNDIRHLNWRCPSCHKLRDAQTERGISTVGNSENLITNDWQEELASLDDRFW